MKKFNDISSQIWQEMRKGTPYEEPEPDTGEYEASFISSGIDLPKLVKYLKNDRSKKIYNRNEYIGNTGWTEYPVPQADGFAVRRKEIPMDIPFTYEKERGKPITTKIGALLNKRKDYLESSSAYWINIKPKKGNITAQVIFYYKNTEDKRKYTKDNVFALNEFSIQDKYIAVKFSTNDLTEFYYLETTLGFKKEDILHIIANTYEEEIIKADNEDLNFLYAHIPEMALDKMKFLKEDTTFLFTHLKSLSSSSGVFSIFSDKSGAILNLLRIIGNYKIIYEKLYEDPQLIKELYSQMKGSSEIDGLNYSNRVLFSALLNALCTSQGYILSEKNQEIPTFKIGNNYKPDSNIFAFNDQEKDKIFLKQQQIILETKRYYGRAQIYVDKEVKKTVDLDNGRYFHPLDPVYLIDERSKDKTPILVPAIYVKALADDEEWKEVETYIRIGFNMLAIVGGIATLGSTSPFLVALAIADIGLAATDTIVQLNKDKLGKEFLDTWDKIYMIGGLATAAVSAPYLIRTAFTTGIKLLYQAKGATYDLLKTYLIKIILETNIHNFTGNTVKVLSTNTEIVTATKGFFNEYSFKKLQNAGALLISGEVKTGDKVVTQYALAYEGQILFSGEAQEFSQQVKGLKKIYNAEELGSLLAKYKHSRGLFSQIVGKPIKKYVLRKLQEEFRKIGGELLYNSESFEYCLAREKVLGVEIEAITLNEKLILLNKKATLSAVYEELIHTRQFKEGKYDAWASKYGAIIAENLMEKEAAEELLLNAKKWNLPKDQVKLVEERLNIFKNNLKNYNYEN